MNLEEHRARLRELDRVARTIADPEMSRVYLEKAAEERQTIAGLEAAGTGVTPDIVKSAPTTSPNRTIVPRTGVVADLGKAHVHHTESELLKEAARLDDLEKLATERGAVDNAAQWRAQSEEVQAKVTEMRKAAGFTAPLRKMTIGGKTTYLDMAAEADELERQASQLTDSDLVKATKSRAAQIREHVMLEKSASTARTTADAPRFVTRRIEEADRCLAKALEHDQMAEKMADVRDRSMYRQLAGEQRELARKLRREAIDEGGARS
jgi:hypothetical protein